MKINLYCDVWLVPKIDLVKVGDAFASADRFVKLISLNTLLTPGMIYQMENDLVTGNSGPRQFVVQHSGTFENGNGHTLYMVINDVRWLSFADWYDNANIELRRLTFEEQKNLWRERYEQRLRDTKFSFYMSRSGWKLCGNGEKMPPLLLPTL